MIKHIKAEYRYIRSGYPEDLRIVSLFFATRYVIRSEIERLLCIWFGHRWDVCSDVENGIEYIECRRCGQSHEFRF